MLVKLGKFDNNFHNYDKLPSNEIANNSLYLISIADKYILIHVIMKKANHLIDAIGLYVYAERKRRKRAPAHHVVWPKRHEPTKENRRRVSKRMPPDSAEARRNL